VNVLITGGTGAVGINIVRVLAQAGHRVLCLSRRAHDADPAVERFLAPVRHGVTLVPGDVAQPDTLAGVMEAHRPTHVVHAAAITPTTAMERASAPAILQANFMGTVHVLEVARRSQVRRLVYISSGAVYGETDETSVIDETVPVRPTGLYAIAKDASERVGDYLAGLHGLEWTSLRVGWVYGPMERPMAASRTTMSLVHASVRLALAGEEIRLAHLDPVRDWIHAADVGRAVLAVLAASAIPAHTYNLSGGIAIPHRTLLETLARVIPLRYRQVAETDANVPAALTRPRRGPMSIERFAADFGFRPSLALEPGLRDYVDWVRQEALTSA
jgi:nucleoside-diphosphate-sugar epimerase